MLTPGLTPGGGGGCSSYHLRVEKAVLVSLRVSSLKRSLAGASKVPLEY